MTSCGRAAASARAMAARSSRSTAGAIEKYGIRIRQGHAQHLANLAAGTKHQDFQSTLSAASRPGAAASLGSSRGRMPGGSGHSMPSFGVVPQQPAFMLGRVVVGRLVGDVGMLAHHQIAMRESGRHPHDALVLRGEYFAHPGSECRRGATQVDGDVEDLTTHHAHEFSLRLADLVMQPPQHPAVRVTVVVLDEAGVDTALRELAATARSPRTSRAGPATAAA